MNRREQTVQQVFDHFNARELDVISEITHPDLEIVSQSSRFAGEPYRGYEGMATWLDETLDVFDEWSVAIEEIAEQPNGRVLAAGRLHMRGRESGATVDVPCAWVFDFEGERIARMETFPNQVDEARSAAAR